MSKEQEFQLRELRREVAGMQKEITKLHRARALTDAELKEYKRTNDRRVRDLEIREAVLLRHIPRKDVANTYDLTAARIGQIVNQTTV